MNKNLLMTVVAVTAALALAGCGNGSAGGNASSSDNAATSSASAKETVSGTVTGFGSVYVEGVKYEDRSAQVSIEHDSGTPRRGVLSDIKLGMRVFLATDSSGQASTVTIGSEVMGSISSLLPDGFVVAGQTVKVSIDPASPTVFEHVANLSGLALNDRVEVHGTRDANNHILATRVERKDPSSATVVRVLGSLTDLNATAKTFTLGGLLVSYSDSTRILPVGTVLADGQTVAVWSDQPVNAGTLMAKSVVSKRKTLGADDRLRVGGTVRALDFATQKFRLDGFDVEAAGAAYRNGTAADLANGRRVRVQGQFVDGKVVASELRFVRDQGDATVELSGGVTDFVSNASFKLRGVPIDASGAAVVFANGTSANLADGVGIRLTGQVENNVVKPSRIEFATSEGSGTRVFYGTVSGYAPTAGTFSILNVGMRLLETTTFRNSDGSSAARADFGDLDRIRVKGNWVVGTFNVSEVVFESASSLVVNRAEGGVYEFDALRGQFRINGTVVTIGTTTTFEGSRENLRNGVLVEVEGTVVDGKLVARKVEVKSPDDSVNAFVRGMISDYVSIADFRVLGQRVNASAAAFVKVSAADLANGRTVEARGPVTDGILQAVTVTSRD